MFRYKIFLYSVENNKIVERVYLARHFEVNNIALHIYPVDFSDYISIHLDSDLRFEVIPYRYLIEINS